ncbi:MAG TPA: universal stress protein [Rhodospirillales bacterium]|nr:universal stress protein [Rhodospirillales bacterium]
MALKDLLVHIDQGPHADVRLEAAITLASGHDAHLIGVHAISHPRIPNYIRMQIGEDVLKAQAAFAAEAAARAEAAFHERAARAGVRAEWRAVDGEPLPALNLHGRYVDLVIVGQRDPSGEDASDDPTIPDQLILSLGRPVLVVPYSGSFTTIGKTVLVAWDASRLATRAVNDALPFLVAAKKVCVLAVNPDGGDDGHGQIPSADICLHLARHGVNAEAEHLYADDIDVGDVLLDRAADIGADLLVSGAYGHARWREQVLGGVTRHLLRHMTVPVLMAH